MDLHCYFSLSWLINPSNIRFIWLVVSAQSMENSNSCSKPPIRYISLMSSRISSGGDMIYRGYKPFTKWGPLISHSYGHLLVISGYFYGIIHSINGVFLVLIIGISGHNWSKLHSAQQRSPTECWGRCADRATPWGPRPGSATVFIEEAKMVDQQKMVLIYKLV